MTNTVPKQVERLWVLVALYNQTKGDTTEWADLTEVAEQKLRINKTRLNSIHRYLLDEGFIKPFGSGFTCWITNPGVAIVQSQAKRTDKELILEFLDYVEEGREYDVEEYFERVGIKSTMKIKHLYALLVNYNLVDENFNPYVWPNYKGKELSSESYDELFGKTTGEIPLASQYHTNININGHGNIANTGANVVIDADIRITVGDKKALAKVLKDNGVEEDDVQELMTVVDQEQPPKEGGFGQKVNQWIVKLITKSIHLGTKVGTSVASNLIVSAIKHYYG